jgi:hypothetical protein
MWLLTDENFNGKVLSALQQRLPGLDVVRAQDVGLMSLPDEEVLAWAAAQNRITLSHDVETMPPLAWDRVRQGLPMPGLLIIGQHVPDGVALQELVVVAICSSHDEWANRVEFLP